MSERVRSMIDNEYWTIQAWGRMMGSFPSYVSEQITKARASHAPTLAIYERNGVWRTLADVTNPQTIAFLKRWADDHGVVWPL